MTTAEEYRSKATECLCAAEATSDPDIRAQWRQVAQSWHRLAQQAEEGLVGNPHLPGGPPARRGVPARGWNTGAV